MLLELGREARTEPVIYIIKDQCTDLLAGFATRPLGRPRSLWHIVGTVLVVRLPSSRAVRPISRARRAGRGAAWF
jgi:hypothetical protein